MYYAETIIDGKLCCQETQGGKWVPLTQEQLTMQILQKQTKIQSLLAQVAYLEKQVKLQKTE